MMYRSQFEQRTRYVFGPKCFVASLLVFGFVACRVGFISKPATNTCLVWTGYKMGMGCI